MGVFEINSKKPSNSLDRLNFIHILQPMNNETIYINGNYDITYEVSISESRYGFDGQKSIEFTSSTFCGSYFLETIMFNREGLPQKLDQSLSIDYGQGATISGEEMAKARTWAWKHIKNSI